MATIYLPSDYIDNCNVIHSDFIRSYLDSSYTSWVDIYIHQDYMLQFGSSSVAESVVCDDLNSYTSNEYYKLGQRDEWFNMFILAFLFALFLLNIRRFARNDNT